MPVEVVSISAQDEQPETWKPIAGWPDYEVSDQGRIKSRKPRNGQRFAGFAPPWRLLRPSIRKASGYAFVGLVGENGKWDVGVHRLVLLTFVGPCPPGMETRHLDGVRHDNRLTNLCWGTQVENAADRIRHGTHARGEAHANARLNEDRVRDLRECRAAGMTWKQLAAAFRVDESTARAAASGRNWKHVG